MPPGGAGRAVVSIRMGGHEQPMRTNRLCRVCMSPYRFDIEEALIGGTSYAKIVERLGGEDSGHTLRTENVKNHYYNGHLALEQSTTRQIVEERAQAVGKRIEDATESLVDGITLLQVVVQKGFEEIAKGAQTPDVRESIAAAKMLADLGVYDDSGVDQQAIVQAFMIYHESAQAMMSPDQFEAFGKALAANPVLAALSSRYEPREGPEPETPSPDTPSP